MRMGLCFFTAECSTFQFMCSSGAVSYTRVINDGIRRTTWNHFKTNVKNNNKCFPPSSLSIADGYLIVNTLLSRETEMGRRGDGPLPDWFATASHWADGKIESWTWRCSRLTDGRNVCWVWTSIQWQSRVSDSTLVCELMVAFVFVTETDDMWSELQVANPNTSSRSPAHLPHWTDLHTMHTLAHEYVVGGPFSFRFSNAWNTLTRSPQGSGAKQKQKPVSLAL